MTSAAPPDATPGRLAQASGCLADHQIADLVRQHGMIEPFKDHLVSHEGGAPVISYGLSSFGYDVRAASEWKIFTNTDVTVVDPKHFDERCFVTRHSDQILIPPNSFALTRSVEYLRIPDNVVVFAVGKSTYARCGINSNTTILEPGWEGHITLMFSNTSPLPARMYGQEGCMQLIFFAGKRPVVTYPERGGKYQGTRGVTVSRMPQQLDSPDLNTALQTFADLSATPTTGVH